MKFYEGLILLAIFFVVVFASWATITYFTQKQLEADQYNQELQRYEKEKGLNIAP